ncbi:hypothetical protein Nmel_007520 [Mimus melanotis]
MLGGGVLHTERVKESVQVDTGELDPISREELPQNCNDTVRMQVEIRSFPVFKVAPNTGQHDRREVIAWHVVQDLQDKVERYGLGSTQIMQIIKVCSGMRRSNGRHCFSNPDVQATWDPLVLKQCQKIDFAAMLKTIEVAAPKSRYVKIIQGPRELFLQFVGKVETALEKQVEDDNLRQMVMQATGQRQCKCRL